MSDVNSIWIFCSQCRIQRLLMMSLFGTFQHSMLVQLDWTFNDRLEDKVRRLADARIIFYHTSCILDHLSRRLLPESHIVACKRPSLTLYDAHGALVVDLVDWYRRVFILELDFGFRLVWKELSGSDFCPSSRWMMCLLLLLEQRCRLIRLLQFVSPAYGWDVLCAAIILNHHRCHVLLMLLLSLIFEFLDSRSYLTSFACI